MLRRDGRDDNNRIAECHRFNPPDSLACKTNKKVDRLKSAKILALVFFAGFITNLIWENLQAPLYQGYEGFIAHFLFCLGASVIDGVVTVAFYFVIGLIRNNYSWLIEVRARDILLLFILGAVTAFAFEKWAISSGWWNYNPNMPIIFGVGLTPLIQLPILSVLSIYLIKFLAGKRKISLAEPVQQESTRK